MKKVLQVFFLLLCYLQSHSQCFTKAITEGNKNSDYFAGMSSDDNGNLYVIGMIYGTTVLGQNSNPQTLQNGGHFIAKYDKDLSLIWVKKMPSWSYGIATDSVGNSYITGNFCQTRTFGEGNDTITLTSYNNTWDIFVAKYDKDGNLLWARKDGGSYIENANAIAIDKQGNCYVTGNFYYKTVFGNNNNIDSAFSIGSGGDDDHFVSAYDANGNFKWLRTKGSQWDDMGGKAITVNNSGEIIVVADLRVPNSYLGQGRFLNITKYDQIGTQLFEINEEGFFIAEGNSGAYQMGSGSLVSDKNNNIYLTGSFGNSCEFGGQTYTSTSSNSLDLFLVKYDNNGNFLKLFTIGGQGSQHGFALSTANDKVYLAGIFADNQVSLNINNIPTTFYNYGVSSGSDGMILEFDSAFNLNSAVQIKEYNLMYMNKFIYNSQNNKFYLGGSFDFSVKLPAQSGEIILNVVPDTTQQYPSYWEDLFIAVFDPQCAVSGINEIENNSSLSVYPNPTGGNFQINYSSSEKTKLQLNIIDSKGKTVYTETFQGDYNKAIDLGTKAKGVYFVEIVSAGKKRSVKRIVLN